MAKIQNAQIKSVRIGYERGVFLTVWVCMIHEDGNQDFGGYVLGADPTRSAKAAAGNETGLLASWVNGILKSADVEDIAEAAGKTVRIKKEDSPGGKILAIGHPIKDYWFCPEEA